MADELEQFLIKSMPERGRPSRTVRRLAAEVEQRLAGEPIRAAASGDSLVGGFPKPMVLAVTPTRAVWTATRSEPDEVMLADITSAEVAGSTLTIGLPQGSRLLFTSNHSTSLAVALASAGVALIDKRESPTGTKIVRLDQRLTQHLDRCVVIGGSGPYPLSIGETTVVRFEDGALTIGTATGVAVGPTRYEDLVSMGLDGAGRVTTSAGFIGGGFGLQGAATGIAIASVLNLLTEKTSIESILQIEFSDGEVFLANEQFTPTELRLMLSEVFVALRA